MKRTLLALAVTGAIVLLLALLHDVGAPAPTVTTARTIDPIARPQPWADRRDREPPPDGYIPAWQVNPPRPSSDPAPVVHEPVAPVASTDLDPVRAVDGDRPTRPVPGL
jgi:hypothetical protein